jgi:hypothetical protein
MGPPQSRSIERPGARRVQKEEDIRLQSHNRSKIAKHLPGISLRARRRDDLSGATNSADDLACSATVLASLVTLSQPIAVSASMW